MIFFKARHSFWILWIFLTILVPQIVLGGPDLTNEEKKQIVYKMYEEYRKDFPSVEDISPHDAMKMMADEKVIFVDTREQAEMQVSMLPGSVPKDEFLKKLSRYKDHTIIAYCTISYRSGKFAKEMAKAGILIYNLKGGLLAWVLEGGKVYDRNGETKRIHVYGKKWNYLPGGYEPVFSNFFEKYF